MAEFRIVNSVEEDLIRYPRFFSMAPLFNTLNIPAHPEKTDNNIISRMTQKSVDKLVFWQDEPVFYVSFKKTVFTYSVNTMIFDSYVDVDRQELYRFIRRECFNKVNFISPNGRFEYYTADQRLNHEVLEGIGFTVAKNHRIMNIMLERRITPATTHSGDLEVLVVEGKDTIRDRVMVQNEVFQNKNRIPLDITDVQKEMKNQTYIPELSLLLTADKRPCGYGQIIQNQSAYYLVNFGIIPEYQGLGYSHYLLEALLDKAESLGVQIILLEVFEDNLRAVKLYEKHGFKTMYNKCQWVYQKEDKLLPLDNLL